jgi:peptidyl-prolyl cis-trans isomerase SurA
MTMRKWLTLTAVITVAWVVTFLVIQQFKPAESGSTLLTDQPSRLPKVDNSLSAAAAHILVAHNQSEPSIPGITRTPNEAKQLAYQYSVMANDRGADFSELARLYSDDPRVAGTGGYLGIQHRGSLPLEFEVSLFNLEPGEIFPAAQSKQGYHVIKRLPIQLAFARHILITWQGSQTTDTQINRTRNQARLLAEEVLLACRRSNADFCELSSQYSDDTGSRFTCGEIGVIEPSATHPDFESVLFRLRAGEISDLVETPFGFHIIQRVE